MNMVPNNENSNSLSLDEISRRREQLCFEIESLEAKKIQEIDAIKYCYEFVKEAIRLAQLSSSELASSLAGTITMVSGSTLSSAPPNLSLGSPISQKSPQEQLEDFDKLRHHGRVYTASQCIPSEFEELENDYLSLSSDGKKFFSYIYHQFFISIIAIVDDYLSKLLVLVLKAYPERMEDKVISVKKVNFSSLSIEHFDLNEMTGLNNPEAVITAIDSQIEREVQELMHGSPIDYYSGFQKYLDLDKNFLRLEWLDYAERCLRRNSGVHSGWMGSKEYNLRLREIKKKDTGSQLGFSDISGDFVGFDAEYFCETYRLTKIIIQQFSGHCLAKFSLTETEQATE